jgi:hypothetical protein
MKSKSLCFLSFSFNKTKENSLLGIVFRIVSAVARSEIVERKRGEG